MEAHEWHEDAGVSHRIPFPQQTEHTPELRSATGLDIQRSIPSAFAPVHTGRGHAIMTCCGAVLGGTVDSSITRWG